MKKMTITRFKWFWVWQDEAEEKWLEEMFRQGYHLSGVSLPCIYTFIKSEPAEFTYRLDYRRFSDGAKQDYLKLFQDAGWEYLGEISLWQYFRKRIIPGEVNEIFTDTQSKIAKYRRILAYLGILYISLFFILIGRIIVIPALPWWGNVHLVIVIVLALMTYALVKIFLRIRRLQSS